MKMKSEEKIGTIILLIIAVIAIVALAFLFKTLKASGQAAIPIHFAEWDCSCRGWCRQPSPAYGEHVISRAKRPTIAEARIACIEGLRLQCKGFLKYFETIKCEQYSKQAATPW